MKTKNSDITIIEVLVLMKKIQELNEKIQTLKYNKEEEWRRLQRHRQSDGTYLMAGRRYDLHETYYWGIDKKIDIFISDRRSYELTLHNKLKSLCKKFGVDVKKLLERKWNSAVYSATTEQKEETKIYDKYEKGKIDEDELADEMDKHNKKYKKGDWADD